MTVGQKPKHLRQRAALIIALLLILCIGLCACDTGVSNSGVRVGGIEVHYLDVGQADSILVRCGKSAMLIDGGNVADNQFVVAYISELGIGYLDYVVCTHAHEDHVGGLAGVMAAFDAGMVYCPVESYNSKAFSDFKKYTEAQGLSLTIPEVGEVFQLGGAEVTVLGPVKDYTDANNTSVVLRVDYGDVSFLFTGDAERDSENDIMDSGQGIQSSVLKVGHHGSRTSTSYRWLYEVNPEYAVISCGVDNDYGHPHEEVTTRLRDAGVTVYRTDQQGSIVCKSDGESIYFETELNVEPAIGAPEPGSGYYIGNVNSKKFHTESCNGLPSERNRVFFVTRSEAVEAGYEPCSFCRP